MPIRIPRMIRPRAERAVLLVLLAVLPGLARPARAAQERRARLLVEFGIDGAQRKYYRPSFSFVTALPFIRRTGAFFDLAYLQRSNGRLQGPIDFQLVAGLERQISDTLSADLSLTHFCRHVTSVDNPYILNFNEAVGRVRLAAGSLRLGLGFGGYVGGSPGHSRLLAFDARAGRFVLPELSIEAALKWADFADLYYEAGLALALGPGIDLLLRSARTYGLPAESFIGLRLASDGAAQDRVARFDMTFGLTPFHDDYKLVAGGGYRLVFLKTDARRLLVNISFDTPILNGRGFFAQFWPDRMLYAVEAQYEVAGRGFFAAWYGRYTLDMPSDRPAPFAARLATGLVVRNRPDFDVLDAPVRIEASAGYDFRGALDAGLRAGANTVGGRPFDVGADFDWRLADGRSAYEVRLFAALGREISIRPFIGIRKIALYAMNPPAGEPVGRDTVFGVSLFKWY